LGVTRSDANTYTHGYSNGIANANSYTDLDPAS
jgi:hypothetical protein